MNMAGIVGFLLSLGLIIGACAMGSRGLLFINIPSIIVVGGVVMGLQLSTVGAKTFMKTLCALLIIFRKTPVNEIQQEDADNLRSMALQFYAAGFIGVLIGWIQILANMEDPAHLGAALSVSMLTVFYAAVLAECIVRPCANRIEYVLAQDGVDG